MLAFKRICKTALYLLALLGLITLGASATRYTFKDNGIRKSFERVHLEQTKEEVRRNFASQPKVLDLDKPGLGPPVLEKLSKVMMVTEIDGWVYPGHGIVFVGYDDKGQVILKGLKLVGYEPASIKDDIPFALFGVRTNDQDVGGIEIVIKSDP